MEKDIRITFNKRGLRSNIEVDLCAECPRQDNKGCCGYYSPVFYVTDLVYIAGRCPQLLDRIWGLPRLTVLDASVTVDSLADIGDSFQCQFHSRERGCLLEMDLRESVCRHFVCPGIAWWQEESLAPWKAFFDRLADFENSLNNSVAAILKKEGLSLRNPSRRTAFISRAAALVDHHLYRDVDFGLELPVRAEALIRRQLVRGEEWPL